MKVGIVGAGNVGATVAQEILHHNLADVALVDVVEGLAEGKALDLAQAGAVLSYDREISGSTDTAALAGSDVVVIAAGRARRPGMDRSELMSSNSGIVAEVAKAAKSQAPESVVIVVTNPVDVMSYVAFKTTGFPHERVVGMAGVLDGARMAFFLARAVGASVRDVSTLVLGGHGDDMVPITSHATAGGVPVTELVGSDDLAEVVVRTQKAGGEIVRLLGKGSAYYAPGASVYVMVDSVLRDAHRILPASVYLTGQYGLSDVFIGVPARLGAGGVEAVVEMGLSDEERKALGRSAEDVRALQSEYDAIERTR
jgi:malate dehydrogenase